MTFIRRSRLFLVPHTANDHLKVIVDRAGVRTRTELIVTFAAQLANPELNSAALLGAASKTFVLIAAERDSRARARGEEEARRAARRQPCCRLGAGSPPGVSSSARSESERSPPSRPVPALSRGRSGRR